jgi:hypothetical protein
LGDRGRRITSPKSACPGLQDLVSKKPKPRKKKEGEKNN